MVPVHLTALCNDTNLAFFREVAELLFHGFKRAGAEVAWVPRSVRRGALNVMLAAHRLPPSQLSQLVDERVILNLEQVCAQSAWGVIHAPTYRTLLQSSPVIDYSERNRAWLGRELQVEAEIVMLGHAPELERIVPAGEQDIDVLFYGAITPRRKETLSALQRSGLRVVVIDGEPLVFAGERDALIARSRVVLNLHAHDTHIFEQVRVNYLLVNGKAVVSEVAHDTEVPDPYRAWIEAAWGADAIVDACRRLAGNDRLRREREESAREGIRAYPQSTLLGAIACLQPAFGRG